ncbi:MAG: twin-arginine translocase subunit TatC [Acidobacteria bacterium]|nr:twin-arginine translocase subunit TatC [Acidobacteriota bacterium]
MPLKPEAPAEGGLLAGGSSDPKTVPHTSSSSEQVTPSEEVLPGEPSTTELGTPYSGYSGGAPPPPSGGFGGGDGGDDEPEPTETGRMSFFDHLEELRRRIFYSLAAVAVGMAGAWVYADDIYRGLALPLTSVLREFKMDDHLVYTNPTAPFNLYLRLAMIAGLFISSPFLIYQLWGFISPGLYRHEKKYAFPFILFCSALFLSGGAFAYYVAFPAALRFLLGFGSQFRPFITVDEYFSLASTIILGLAVVFELPVLILFLTLLRIVTPGFLLRNVRYAFLIIVIIAAALTPTADVVNMMIFAAPLLALYFLGVGLSYLVLRSRRSKERTGEA